MIKAGSHGQLRAAGNVVSRCTDWKLNIDREIRDQTPVYRWDEQSIPLGRSSTGEVTVVYDPDDLGTAAIISSFRTDVPSPIALQLRTDKNSNSGYDLNAHISSVGTTVVVRDAHRVRLSFTTTGTITPVGSTTPAPIL